MGNLTQSDSSLELGPRLRFDEQAFLANYTFFCARSKGETGAVIKSNGYGTGAIRAAHLLREAGCKHFFVANTVEATEIVSHAGGRIYVLLGPQNGEDASVIAYHGFVPVLNTTQQIEMWLDHRTRECAVQFDTGMKRLGLQVDDCHRLPLEELEPCLVMTHLACADNPDHPLNRHQVDSFGRVLDRFQGIPTSIGNSAGTLLGPEYHGDVTRPGIGLFGANPTNSNPSPVLPVVSCEGKVLQIHTVDAKQSVGYRASYKSSKPMRVATIGIGYAHGISRGLSNRGFVAFRGKRLPIVGQVSMDMTQIDCSSAPDLDIGDFVEFFGSQIPIEEVANSLDTISYEILTSVGQSTASRDS